MMLTAEDRKILQAIWAKVASHCDELGSQILDRLFLVYPQTKTYFPHFVLSPGSEDIRRHGQKIYKTFDNCIKHLDSLRATLADLSDLHAYNLRVDPVNFKLLGKCVHVVLACHLKGEYTPQAYAAFDKFLCEVSDVLSEKYR